MIDVTLIDTPLDVLLSSDADLIRRYIASLKAKQQTKEVNEEVGRIEKLLNSIDDQF